MSVNTGGYRELEKFTVCPTCEGNGKIKKDSEREYIALIPLRDKRLRPRRTGIKILGAIIVCCLLFSLLMFFLIIRPITLNDSDAIITPDYTFISNSPKYVYIEFLKHIKVKNNNYFAITVSHINISGTFSEKEFLLPHSHKTVSIAPRTTQEISLPCNVTLTNEVFPGIVDRCLYDYPIFRELTFFIRTSVQSVTYSGKLEAYTSAYVKLNCYPTPVTTIPTTTKPTTPTIPVYSTTATSLQHMKQ